MSKKVSLWHRQSLQDRELANLEPKPKAMLLPRLPDQKSLNLTDLLDQRHILKSWLRPLSRR